MVKSVEIQRRCIPSHKMRIGARQSVLVVAQSRIVFGFDFCSAQNSGRVYAQLRGRRGTIKQRVWREEPLHLTPTSSPHRH